MARKTIGTAAFCTALVVAAAGTAFASDRSSGGPYVLDWYTIDGGGGTSSGGAYTLSGTIGQHDASTPLSGGAYELGPGFWYGAGVDCVSDFDGNGLVNFADVQAFVLAFNAASPAADVDGNGVLNVADVQTFILAFNAGC